MSDIKLSPEEIEDMLDRAAGRGTKEALRVAARYSISSISSGESLMSLIV